MEVKIIDIKFKYLKNSFTQSDNIININIK